ncbi:hypothetical protein TNCV_2316221 [Trichonephila clavipes]|nr:hypothetical protein TNCV_2316221 [Trichonephila clavipes]
MVLWRSRLIILKLQISVVSVIEVQDMNDLRTSSHGCLRCIGSSCITRLTPSRVRSLDVPPCTMSRTPTRFKQHRVTTTRPMNYYAVSTRLGRSRHRFFSLSRQDVDSRS